MTTPLSRRTLLRGAAGTALALPFLEAMLPARASAAGGPPSRYLISFAGHSLGSDGAPELDTHWVPKTVGTGYETPTAIAPLATVKQHVSVVSGLKIPTARSNGGVVPLTGKPDNFHGYMLSPLLSGMPRALGSTWCRGATSDQLMARTLAVCARDDTVTPLYFTEELVRLIPGARAYVLPDGGHAYPNVHGAEFRRVMTAFLLES